MTASTLDEGAEAFRLLTGFSPMGWQTRLLGSLLSGDVPSAISLPTGLGKTAVMTLWLIARAHGAPLPRRLVYVVDRRVVVDQASAEATRLQDSLSPEASAPLARRLREGLGLGPTDRLPVSTLRGSLRENPAWRLDPTSPAIIVGTVDMIGSRLLFEGYGVSRRMRPLHAALLGCDALILLDEAHLVPPFEALLRTVATDPAMRGRSEALPVPVLRVLPLSATGRDSEAAHFRLTEAEASEPLVAQRIRSRKRLRVLAGSIGEAELPAHLAERAAVLAGTAAQPKRVLVFCDRREHASAVQQALARRGIPCGLLVGERRGLEREGAAAFITEEGFLAGALQASRPACLVATSAGEVGIDLDADHLVADVVSFERIIQRLGRVNRRGERAAEVELVLVGATKAGKGEAAARQARAEETLELLGRLPVVDGGLDASPAALDALQRRADLAGLRAVATTPEPLRPALTRALVDAWSLTGLLEHSGRPEVAPWLRGWVDDEPEATLFWRRVLPWRRGEALDEGEVSEVFEAAPPVPAETLAAPVWRVAGMLRARANALKDARADLAAPAAIVLNSALEMERGLTVGDLARLDPKRLAMMLAGRFLALAAALGGLSPEGLLDESAPGIPTDAPPAPQGIGCTSDAPEGMPGVALRVTVGGADDAEPPLEGWVQSHAWPAVRDDEGVPTRLLRFWTPEPPAADPALARRAQSLIDHAAAVASRAASFAERLALPAAEREMLTVAATLHDAGKASARWQRAFSAPAFGGPYAKTAARRVDLAVLDGYRHEFGSLVAAARDPALMALSPELRELALHLVAAHHGRARPVIEPRGADMPPSIGARFACDAALRSAALQTRWGPWGLAWWEALLRLADAAASAELEGQG